MQEWRIKLRPILLILVLAAGWVETGAPSQIHHWEDLIFFSSVAFVMFGFVSYIRAKKKHLRFETPLPDHLKFWDQPLFQGNASYQREFDVAILTIVFGMGRFTAVFLMSRQFSYDAIFFTAAGLGILTGLLVCIKMGRKSLPKHS